MGYVEVDTNELVWFPSRGYGVILPEWSMPIEYGEDYFNNYEELKHSEQNDPIQRVRINLVNRYLGKSSAEEGARVPVLDYGCGACAFIEARGEYTYGWDVNRTTQRKLFEAGKLLDPEKIIDPIPICMWDVFEHLTPAQHTYMLQKASSLFMSIPCFESAEAAVKSKHLKPGEHLWYFTEVGLVRYMAERGFSCLFSADLEGQFGREDIRSFVFVRQDYLRREEPTLF